MKKGFFLTVLFLFEALYAQNDTYVRKLVKNRACKQAKEGVSEHQRKIYIYADDKDIKKAMKNSENSKEINIASPHIKNKPSVREVNIYVESKKPIKIKGVKNFSIGSPTIEGRNNIKKINIDVELNKKVEIK